MTTLHLSILDMTCGGCTASVQKAVQALDGITSISIDLPSRQAVIGYDEAQIDQDAILQAIDDAGFEPEIITV